MRNNSDDTEIEKKTSSSDGILNEMIRYTSHKISNTKLNLIVSSGHFPHVWS